MPVRQTIAYTDGTFFITFTCHSWIPLIKKVNGYDLIYKWFQHLQAKGHFINGYVIMPNHLHAIISFRKTNQSINTIIGNGKRFIAYEIIKRLQLNKDFVTLQQLQSAVEPARRLKNKLHEVWQLSFYWKDCRNKKFIDQKLNYMHNNPCTGKWQLSTSPEQYMHSSAKFYINDEHSAFPVTNYMEMEDVDLGE